MLRLEFRLGLFIIFIAVVFSCNNDFDINGEYIEKTVVVGILDYGEDTNFLRIEKTFLDVNTSAFLLATDPANYYYEEDDLFVYMEQWTDGNFIHVIPVQYVDGDTLGIIKEEGLFSGSPNILFRITEKLDSLSTYKLFVVNNSTGDTITSQTNIVGNFYVYYPTLPETYINYTDTSKITYTCKQALNGKIYELWMRFNYYEKNISNGDSILKHADWQIFNNKFGDNILGNGNISYSLERNLLYSFLSGALEEDDNVIRYYSSINFYWYAGGVEVYDQYLNVLANLGINEDYISPEFTNINGGLGMFSSRHKIEINNVHLYDDSIDSLACGKITKQLNFVSSFTNPAYPGCGF